MPSSSDIRAPQRIVEIIAAHRPGEFDLATFAAKPFGRDAGCVLSRLVEIYKQIHRPRERQRR